jgi:hypothetical protein
MKDELRILIDQIQHITDYEDLYGSSEPMQELFFRSYTNIIRFWHRVHKECKRTGACFWFIYCLVSFSSRSDIGAFRRSMTSSNFKKLSAIVCDLKTDVACMSEKAFIVEASLGSQERSEAQKEREKAEIERNRQSEWREKQVAHNYRRCSFCLP